jgi:glycerophosphoryl diester phosphodiesterase
MLNKKHTALDQLIFSALSLILGLSNSLSATPSSVVEPVEASSMEARWLDGVDLAVFLGSARESERALLQAHRAGPRSGYAENALSTMEASLADGAVFIEIDVGMLADGILVLMHDDTVDRTTTGTGALSSYTLDTFKSLQLVDPDGTVLAEAPPTLAEAFELLNGRGIAQLDMKGIPVDAIAEAIRGADAVGRSLVITYSSQDAIRMHELVPEVMISVGLESLELIEHLQANEFDLTRLQAWIGVGNGQPDLDQALADLGIETSYGNFPAEAEGSADYALMQAAGAEVLSVDNVPSAAQALNAREAVRAVRSYYYEMKTPAP